jgi:hypothetical protein
VAAGGDHSTSSRFDYQQLASMQNSEDELEQQNYDHARSSDGVMTCHH